MKVVALDYGSARTGVAVSDPTGTVARPLTTIRGAATDTGFNELLTVIDSAEAQLIVVGLPLTLRGERGEQARETEAFVERLRSAGSPSRPTTSGSPRCSPAGMTHAPPPTS